MYLILRKITRVLYRYQGSGLPRIADYIRKIVARYGTNETVRIDDFFGAKFYCSLCEHMGGQIFFRGSYSGDQLEIVRKILPVDGMFMDIGANQGEFTVFAAQIAPKGRVLSFEPIESNLERLYRNIEINKFDHVEVFPIALGNERGDSPIYDASLPYSDGSVNEGLHTLHSSSDRCNPAGIVQVRMLDEVLATVKLSRLDLMKIDIEGSEFFALKGGRETLARYTPTILLEICRETCASAGYSIVDIVLFFDEHGYQIYSISNQPVLVPLQPSDFGEFQNVLAVHYSRVDEINELINKP